MTVLPAIDTQPYGYYDYLTTPQYHIGDWHGNCVDAWGVAWVVDSEDGWSGSPARRVAVTDNAQDDGGYPGTPYYASRTITLSGKAVCSSRGQMLAAKRRFAAVLSARTPQILTVVEEDLTLQAAVIATGDNKAKDSGGVAFDWSLQMTAADPRKYEPVETAGGATLPSVADIGGRGYPRVYPLRYAGVTYTGNGRVRLLHNGTYPVPGVLTVQGPLTNHVIQHAESARTLRVGTALGATDIASYDLALRQFTVNGTVRSDLLVERGWFLFQPGVNTLLFRGSGSPAATLSASFYGAYI